MVVMMMMILWKLQLVTTTVSMNSPLQNLTQVKALVLITIPFLYFWCKQLWSIWIRWIAFGWNSYWWRHHSVNELGKDSSAALPCSLPIPNVFCPLLNTFSPLPNAFHPIPISFCPLSNAFAQNHEFFPSLILTIAGILPKNCV